MGMGCSHDKAAMDFQERADEISANFSFGPRVCILGSKSFHSSIGPGLCTLLGTKLAQEETNLGSFILVTGGNFSKKSPSIQQQVAQAFHDARTAGGKPRVTPDVYHLRPASALKEGQWAFGQVVIAGSTGPQRREILARVCQAYVLVEGGDGAAQEVRAVLDAGGVVIPVACTGGVANGMYCSEPLRMKAVPDAEKWPNINLEAWQLVTDPTEESVERLVLAILRLVTVVACKQNRAE